MNLENLIEGLQKNDPLAFENFVDEYSLIIYKVVRGVLRESHEWEYVDECYDDVLMVIWQNINKYGNKCPFHLWVASVAKNKALDYKRKLKKSYNEVEIMDNEVGSESVENEYIIKENIQEIKEMINDLSEEDKKLFVKKFIMEQSVEELCKEYFITEATLYKRISRMRQRLMKKIEENKRKVG